MKLYGQQYSKGLDYLSTPFAVLENGLSPTSSGEALDSATRFFSVSIRWHGPQQDSAGDPVD